MKKYKFPSNLYGSSSDFAVILANGMFPTHPIPLQILENASFLVCCDGAINELINTSIIPNAIVGDCDSLSEENKKRFSNILYHDKDQETNDLTKSVRFCLKKGWNKIIILGATGKREDHTLGNISLVIDYVDELSEVEMITDYGVFVPIIGSAEFESVKGQQVSFFAFNGAKITLQNLRYAVDNRNFSNWWQGTLNEAIAESFSTQTDEKVLVYRSFSNK